jgi:sphingolipid delta-4 desaturase
LFDREISLFNRILRRERGKVAITDVSKPDIEMSFAQSQPAPVQK